MPFEESLLWVLLIGVLEFKEKIRSLLLRSLLTKARKKVNKVTFPTSFSNVYCVLLFEPPGEEYNMY